MHNVWLQCTRLIRLQTELTLASHLIFHGINPKDDFIGELFLLLIDRFYIALFSAVEQSHCARMWFYMNEQLFIARI